MWSMGAYEEAQRSFHRSLDLREQIDEQRLKAHGLGSLSGVLRTLGAYEEAERLARDSVALGQAQGDKIGTARARIACGRLETIVGNYAQAREHLSQSLAAARETGNHEVLVNSLNVLGAVALACGDFGEAQRMYEESRASFTRLEIIGTLRYAEATIGLGRVALARGDLAQAQAHFREALAARACTAWEKMDAIAGTAEAFVRGGDILRAAELLAFVTDHAFTSHETRERVRELLRELEVELPADVFAAATGCGPAFQIEDVVAELMEESGPKPVQRIQK